MRYKLPSFYPRRLVTTGLKGLGPHIDDRWRASDYGTNHAALDKLPFKEVLSRVQVSVRKALSSWSPPSDVAESDWRSWCQELVEKLPYVEHTVNAGLCWTLGQLSPDELGLLFGRLVESKGPLQLCGGGFEAVGAHTSQWDGFLRGPSSALILELKARGKTSRTRFEKSQLDKCIETCQRLRRTDNLGDGTPVAVVLVTPRGADDRDVLGRSLADSWGVGRPGAATHGPRRRVAGPPDVWHVHFEDVVDAAASLGFTDAAESFRFVAQIAAPRIR